MHTAISPRPSPPASHAHSLQLWGRGLASVRKRCWRDHQPEQAACKATQGSPLGCCVCLHADPITWPGCVAWWSPTTCSRCSASRRFCTSSSRHLSQGAGPAAAAV